MPDSTVLGPAVADTGAADAAVAVGADDCAVDEAAAPSEAEAAVAATAAAAAGGGGIRGSSGHDLSSA